MTTFGRILVVLVTVMSLGLLTWATAVYTQRVDWFVPAGSGQAKGRIARLGEEIEGLRQARAEVESQWVSNRAEVLQLEQEIARREQWYEGQLELVRSGTLNGTLQDGVADGKGRTVQKMPDRLDDDLPLDTPIGPSREAETDAQGQPLQPIDWYVARMKDRSGYLGDVQDQTLKYIAERETFTERIIDRPGQKGLRTLILDQIQIDDRSREEYRYLLPQIRNRLSELARVNLRRDSLTARRDEVRNAFGVGGGR